MSVYGGTRSLKDRYADRVGQVAAMVDLAPGGFWVGAGGVLITEKSHAAGGPTKVVGGVGVSGASADEDEHCAIAGAQSTCFLCTIDVIVRKLQHRRCRV